MLPDTHFQLRSRVLDRRSANDAAPLGGRGRNSSQITCIRNRANYFKRIKGIRPRRPDTKAFLQPNPNDPPGEKADEK